MLDNSIDEEIKKRLKKDELISKRAEDIFENFFKEEIKMEEKTNQNEQINLNDQKNEPKKIYKWKKPMAAAACLAVLLGGGNIYASTQGYGNVFFMIKYLVTGEKTEVTDKNEILSDRDIAISYEQINIAKGLTLTVKKLQIKDNEARLFVVSGEKEVLDSGFVPLKFIVCNQDGKLLCNQISARDEQNSGYVTDELVLKDYKNTDKKLVLEVYNANSSKLANIVINIDERKVEVEGEKEALTKISEIELKKFLGFAAGLSQKSKDTENEIKIDLACRMLSTYNPDSSQFVVIDNAISYPAEEVDKMIESFTGETIKDFKDGKFIKLITKNGKKYYTYVEPSDDYYGGECINISNISYCNGIYTVKYSYFYRGGEPDEDVNMDNYDIYEQEICISLNENSNYSKFKVVSKEQPIILKKANQSSNTQNENNNITVGEAETIINEKFKTLENLYLRTALYFQRDSIETEQGRKILDYDKKINSNFTANMKRIIEQNTPWGLNLYNGMQFAIDVGGGYISYNGLVGLEDDIIIRPTEIIANVITNQVDPDGKELPSRSTSIRIIKEGSNWLVDSFDVNIFLGNLDYSSDNKENTTYTNTTNSVSDTSVNTINTNNISNTSVNTTIETDSTSNRESTQYILNRIKRYFIEVHEADYNKSPVIEVTYRKYENTEKVNEIKTTTNIFNTFLGKVNDKITDIDNTTTYNEWCAREQRPASKSFIMMFMYDNHQTMISWDSNNENEIDMSWYNNDKGTIEIDKIKLISSAEGLLNDIMNFYDANR